VQDESETKQAPSKERTWTDTRNRLRIQENKALRDAWDVKDGR
jgi:hypothetical protein